jgi:hypothetical protein
MTACPALILFECGEIGPTARLGHRCGVPFSEYTASCCAVGLHEDSMCAKSAKKSFAGEPSRVFLSWHRALAQTSTIARVFRHGAPACRILQQSSAFVAEHLCCACRRLVGVPLRHGLANDAGYREP